MYRMSLASSFLTLPRTEREKRVKSLSTAELAALKYAWQWWARPEQKEPAGNWVYWLILAGRGFGKTRTGAELVRSWVRDYRFVNLIGATADDARDILIEGESGILAICPKDERPIYKKSDRQLLWPNGATSLIFTADEPDRLRGKQSMKIWGDELAAWRYCQDALDQALFGLRLGNKPQAVFTTTPRPIKPLKDLIADPATIVTRGSTFDNKSNLADAFFNRIVSKYEGTRLGRQELYAEILEDVEGALWKNSMLDQYRVTKAPDMRRIVVAIDPAVSTNKSSDETGIIAVGQGVDKQYYPLADVSGIYSPLEWAKKAIFQYDVLKADAIVAETNNGGDLVEANLKAAGFVGRVIKVHASKGKATRAEPIVGLYEQAQVHHVGSFPTLETQMTTWSPKEDDSPDRVDALVWAITELMQRPEPKKASSHQG
jgi:phage terminase large subunit-like protein